MPGRQHARVQRSDDGVRKLAIVAVGLRFARVPSFDVHCSVIQFLSQERRLPSGILF